VTGMHRLQVGRFTREDVNQAFCFPVIVSGGDFWSPAPQVLFDPTYGDDHSKGPQSWTKNVIFDQNFRIVHDVNIIPRMNKGLDTVIISSREGITHLFYDLEKSAWDFMVIGTGTPKELGTPQYWGSGSSDYCRIGDDEIGYIATCEAFHGNTVTVYTKSDDAPKGYESLLDSKWWTRHIIDSFGPLDEHQQTGTIHHVRKFPLVGDVEPFGIAGMGEPIGTPENQGVFMYKPIDIRANPPKFSKIQVHGESSARIATGCFSVPGQLDVASISYYVPGYHTGPEPTQIRISNIGATKLVGART